MPLTDARVKDAKIIVNLGDRADGGAWIFAGGLLLDADRRSEAGKIIDVRLLQLTEKLTRVGRQRLDVAALTFGVERIEGEGRFTGAADAGEDDQLMARQF